MFKILIICSKHFYYRIPEIKEEIEKIGWEVLLPNSYEDPFKEEHLKCDGRDAHIEFKQKMMRLQEQKVQESDAVLVLNFKKEYVSNYIGGATFMEIVKAWELGKRIFLFNPIPENSIITDELIGINPKVIYRDIKSMY